MVETEVVHGISDYDHWGFFFFLVAAKLVVLPQVQHAEAEGRLRHILGWLRRAGVSYHLTFAAKHITDELFRAVRCGQPSACHTLFSQFVAVTTRGDASLRMYQQGNRRIF